MKKGFTLIELLGVVLILAVLILVVVPQMLDVMENAKIKAYQDNELSMVKAAENYLAWNRDLLPNSIGDTVEITLNDLVTSEYLDAISDNSGSCDGYILVTKTDSGYSYNPELKCGSANTIGDSTSDALIAHYTFDDFQEPTENIWITQMGKDSDVRVNDDSVDTIIQPFYNLPYDVSSAGEKFALSFDLEYISHDGCDARLLYWEFQKYLTGSFAGSIGSLSLYQTDDGKRLEKIVTIPSDDGTWDSLKTKYCTAIFEEHVHYTDHMVDVMMNDIQLEKKTYSTTYTEHIRTGEVKDYSLNTNNIALDNATTPRWLETEGNGYYLFDGESTLLTAASPDDFTNMSAITISMWISSDNRVDYDCLFYINGMRAYVISGEKINLKVTSNESVTIDKTSTTSVNTGLTGWDYVVFSYDGSEVRVYINGVEETSMYSSLAGTITNGSIINFGQYSDLNPHWFSGYMDDIKIYERALSAEEVKEQYNADKNKY